MMAATHSFGLDELACPLSLSLKEDAKSPYKFPFSVELSIFTLSGRLLLEGGCVRGSTHFLAVHREKRPVRRK